MDNIRTAISHNSVASSVVLRSYAAPVRIGLALLALCVAAQVRIYLPGTDVPITLQSLAVLLIGFLMTPKQAISATGLYLLAGAVGFPVFASPGGLVGTTAGYLIGFAVAAWIISIVSRQGKLSVLRLLAAGTLGTGVIFTCGIAWRALGAALVWDGFEAGWTFALLTGFWPFALKAIVQLLLAVTLVNTLHKKRIA